MPEIVSVAPRYHGIVPMPKEEQLAATLYGVGFCSSVFWEREDVVTLVVVEG